MDFTLASADALLPFILVGLAAQIVDGALGMAFGIICNTLLVAVIGIPPARASANIHIVETFTTAVSGISHLLHGNIDRRLFVRLLVPGLIGGVTGAWLLSNIDASVVKPFVLGYLVLVGLYLLARAATHRHRAARPRVVEPLGLVGGFLDAAGGGGWGPVVTSNLLVQGVEPRRVVGTVNAVEFFLTLAVSATFIRELGVDDFATATIGLLIGGIAAAPLGAVMAKRIPTRAMLVLVGIVLTLTSAYGVFHALR
ncbi:MAG: sulfite exporter TauE/SafE family protein [Sphingomonas bacterium]